MRWGETCDQRRARLRTPVWSTMFALLPRELLDGRWAWLERIEVAEVAVGLSDSIFVFRPIGSSLMPGWLSRPPPPPFFRGPVPPKK